MEYNQPFTTFNISFYNHFQLTGHSNYKTYQK